MRIGLIGLGLMGAPIADNIRNAGFELVVWNCTKKKAKALLFKGQNGLARSASWPRNPM